MSKLEDKIRTLWNYKLIVISVLCLFTSFVVYSSFWIDLINKYWVNPLMNELYFNDKYAQFTLVFIGGFLIFFYIFSFKNTKHYSCFRCWLNIICWCIFILCYFSEVWEYSKYAYSLTLIPLAEFVLYSKLRYFKKTPKFNPSLEREDTEKTSDSYSRRAVISSTAHMLKDCFYDNGSFV